MPYRIHPEDKKCIARYLADLLLSIPTNEVEEIKMAAEKKTVK